jgi:phospholipid/cholesterol/gamma-HCH transport system substrate-binding protein
METNVNYTVVGAFVIVLFSSIVLAIIWLSAGFSTEKYTTYEVLMKEAVTGLSLEAPVEYNGVNVGTVTSIRIDKQNPHVVELLLKIKSDTPISKGTRARLNVRTLSGVAFILLQDK